MISCPNKNKTGIEAEAKSYSLSKEGKGLGFISI
jgi:hypothetical protein